MPSQSTLEMNGYSNISRKILERIWQSCNYSNINEKNDKLQFQIKFANIDLCSGYAYLRVIKPTNVIIR